MRPSASGGALLMSGVRFYVFFSSRRRHTRYWRDWSSDVCSSDLLVGDLLIAVIGSGWWQIAVVVVLAVAVAVFADGSTLLTNQAGASAVLVATLLPPDLKGVGSGMRVVLGGGRIIYKNNLMYHGA